MDHFFRMAKELRLTIPETMKYFCVSESVAYYVQKYIVYRKRKVFIGKQTFHDLIDVIKKHKNEKYLSPGGIESLLKNFPKFKQGTTLIACFGSTTSKTARDNGLRLDLEAPLPEAPSMTGAIELYIKRESKKKK